MTTFFQPDQLAAGALVVAALGVIFFILKVSVEAFTRLSQASTNANTQAYHATSTAFTEAVRTLREAQEGQRMFYIARLDDLRGEVSQLRERVRDLARMRDVEVRGISSGLEAENDRKDAHITELERENGELRREVKRLQTRMDPVPGVSAAEETIA